MLDMLCLTCGTNGLLLAPVQAKSGDSTCEFLRDPWISSKNRLLAALPTDEVERLLPSFQQISFGLGDVVYEFSGHLDYVYFPTTAIVSLLYTMENGATAEMGLTGKMV
jgi:hypothetical protein